MASQPQTAGCCENCATPLTGPYCAQCGQKHGHRLHSLWHFIREATEGLTHADSRLWLTLAALLARPGALTCEFLAGHRVRYLPPLRLYLVISLVFFLLQAGSPRPPRVVTTTSGPQSHGFQISEGSLSGPAPAPHTAGETSTVREVLTAARAREICQEWSKHPPSFLSRWGNFEQPIYKGCRNFLDPEGASYNEALAHNGERAMFVFLPLLAGCAWLLYRRPRRYYVEHLLFLVHNHSFLFLVLTLRGLVGLATPAAAKPAADGLDLVVFVYVGWYLYRAMRRVYGQGRLLTLAKYAVLAWVYFLTLIVGGTLTAFYSALTA